MYDQLCVAVHGGGNGTGSHRATLYVARDGVWRRTGEEGPRRRSRERAVRDARQLATKFGCPYVEEGPRGASAVVGRGHDRRPDTDYSRRYCVAVCDVTPRPSAWRRYRAILHTVECGRWCRTSIRTPVRLDLARALREGEELAMACHCGCVTVPCDLSGQLT